MLAWDSQCEGAGQANLQSYATLLQSTDAQASRTQPAPLPAALSARGQMSPALIRRSKLRPRSDLSRTSCPY